MKADRRKFLQFLGYGGLALSNGALIASLAGCQSRLARRSSYDGLGVSPSVEDNVLLSKGLRYTILASYGDPINANEVFGFNNDYIDIHPLAKNDLIMWVNHEYVHPLFIAGNDRTLANVKKEMSLVGGSLIRVRKEGGVWRMVANDPFNRGVRGDTYIPFAGGVEIMGKKGAMGTLANCAGGKTPWNTFLTAEENYHLFYGERQDNGEVSNSYLKWQQFFPHPPEHYGWVVEVEPKTGKAKKHVNLGRFAHESATCAVSPRGNVAVYSGDDKDDEHLYKFVSESGDNFDKGVLYVASLEKGQWLPLDLELSPKLQRHFKNQLEVLTYPRKAARLLGATPLDRPEDIEINPLTGDVFVALTNNKPKKNYHGQILKISEDQGDYASLSFRSEVFHTGGEDGGFSCPDNLAFDRNGNLWITTDMSGWSMGKEPYKKFGNNGLFVIPASGPKAGVPIQMASAPVDAEFTGPCFSPDQKTLFLSVQHPGETSKSLESPTSTWPTGKLPKPSVIAIEGEDLEFFTA